MGQWKMDNGKWAMGNAPPPLPVLQPPQPEPLAESDFQLIRQAAVRRRSINSASRTAMLSSVVTLILGISAAPFLLFSFSWSGVIIVAGLCTIGMIEYRGHKRLRRAEASAAKVLGLNQLALLGVIILYCVIQMATASAETTKGMIVSPETREMLPSAMPGMGRFVGRLDQLAPLLVYGFYGLVILLSAGCQGGMALYYFSRRKHIETFNAQTPEWVRRIFVETGA
jgi:hypothetical protein